MHVMSSGGRKTIEMEQSEQRFAWLLVLPVLGTITLIAFFPLLWTVWDSFHVHDLRMPWRGQPFIWFTNYTEALTNARFWEAVAHTTLFTFFSVTTEIMVGLLLALALHHSYHGRGLVRVAVLLPWAIPTVVTALVWRFMFESPSGIVNAVLIDMGLGSEPIVWFIHTTTAWVPIILADVWKTTPFVALLLLAGLQNIDPSLYEAARVDGARPWRQFIHITLPLLQPALLVALIFRTLDAFRVFDLIYVMTGGGPGTATEPIALYTFNVLFQNLRFGFGAALSVLIFLVTFMLALLYIRVLGRDVIGSSP
jgi:ABC-type sugar transport system permease subunit